MQSTHIVQKSVKLCLRCSKELPATTDFFNRSRERKDGLQNKCRDCETAYRRKNRKKIRKRNAAYRASHLTEIKANSLVYRANNREKIKTRNPRAIFSSFSIARTDVAGITCLNFFSIICPID